MQTFGLNSAKNKDILNVQWKRMCKGEIDRLLLPMT